MSYKYKILAENPLGYWTMNGTSFDETSASNHMIWSASAFTTPPILANAGSSGYITSTSSVTINNLSGNYEAFANNCTSNTFTISFWFDFNNHLNGSGYGTTPYTNNQLHLFHIKSGLTTIGRIYFDYITSTIRFIIYGAGGASTNQEAFYTIKDYENQYYIVATYSNKNLSLIVNGFTGNPGYVSDTSYMTQFDKSTISFSINGNSITGTAGKPSSFIVSDVALYSRSLDPRQIVSHITWALNDGKPVYKANILSNISHIKIGQPENVHFYRATFIGKDFEKYGNIENLFVNKNGLNPIKIGTASFLNISGNAVVSIDSSSGIYWTNTGAINFQKINRYFDSSKFAITAKIHKPSTTSTDYIFSLSNINGSDTLYLENAPNAYNLKMYNSQTGSTYTILTASAAVGGSANIGLTMKSNYLLFYSSDYGLTASTLMNTASTQSINFSANTSLVVGNSLHSASSSKLKYANFGLINRPINNFNGFDFTSASTFTFVMRFTDSTKPYVISQYGNWQYLVPTAMYNSIQGSMIDWTSLDNCEVFTSLDRGRNWTKIYRDSPIPSYNLLTIPKNIMIKVAITTEYDASSDVISFNNLRIHIPKNISFNSSGYYFYELTQKISSSNSHPTIKNHNYTILSRPKNLGIRFGGTNPSSASINTASNTVYAVEMWYRPDNINTSASNFILNNVNKTVFLYASTNFMYGGGSLYVNGVFVTSGTSLSASNTPYHLVFIPSSPSSSTLYINGDKLTGSQISGSATYGNITIWNSTPASVNVYNAFMSYISPVTVTISDTNITKVISNSLQTTASAYKIVSR